MSIRELTWQIKQVVLEAQNFTSILPSLRIFSLKTYEIPSLDLFTVAVSYKQGHKVFPLRGQSP